MKKNDLFAVTAIGAAVGLLIQPILGNLSSFAVLAHPSLALRLGIFIFFTLLAPIALWILSLLSKLIPALYQFGKFAAVGVLNTFIDLGVLNLFIFLSGIAGGIGYSAFKTISFFCATTNSFFWNKYWTFNAKGSVTGGETGKFYLFAVIGWVFNVSIATLVVNVIPRPTALDPRVWANIGALGGVGGAFLWDFFSYKFFVFKNKE